MAENNVEETEETISVEQTEKLLHFQEVTQIDELERCKEILSRHNWNIQRAVHSTLNVPDVEPPTPPIQNPQVNHMPQENHEAGVRHRFPLAAQSMLRHHSVLPRQMIYVAGRSRMQPPQGILGWGFFLLISPIKYTFTQVFEVFRFVWRLFFPDPREMITNPEGDVASFIQDFESKFPNHPNFFQGTYAKAQAEAKKELRFLLAFLHDPTKEESEMFCLESLCHVDVIEFINRNMLFWGCSVQTPEGYRVCKILRYPECPCLAVVCLYQNRMTVVGRLEGRLSSQDVIAKLSEVVEVYEPVLVAARADRNALMQNQIIRQEQDVAYLESLQRDKEKVDKKIKEEEEDRLREEKLNQMRQAKVEAKEICRKRKQSCQQELPCEPEIDEDEVVTLQIKMPNGTRLKRRFSPDDSVKAVHDYVYSHESSPPRFKVFANFPRRAIVGCSTDEIDQQEEGVALPLLRDSGFHRNDSLFIQPIENSSEEEEESDDSETR